MAVDVNSFIRCDVAEHPHLSTRLTFPIYVDFDRVLTPCFETTLDRGKTILIRGVRSKSGCQ